MQVHFLLILFQSYQVSKSNPITSLITEIFLVLLTQKILSVLVFQDCTNYHQLDGVLFCQDAAIMFAFNMHAHLFFSGKRQIKLL